MCMEINGHIRTEQGKSPEQVVGPLKISERNAEPQSDGQHKKRHARTNPIISKITDFKLEIVLIPVYMTPVGLPHHSLAAWRDGLM